MKKNKIGDHKIMKRFLAGFAVIAAVGCGLLVEGKSSFARTPPQTQPSFSVQRIEGNQEQKNQATSAAVITEGGKIIWLAGQSGGGSPGNFEGQAKSVIDRMQVTLGRSGASLKDLVYLKVFIKADPQNSEDVIKLLQATFPDGKYPATTIVAVSYQTSLIEIQGVAVVGN